MNLFKGGQTPPLPALLCRFLCHFLCRSRPFPGRKEGTERRPSPAWKQEKEGRYFYGGVWLYIVYVPPFWGEGERGFLLTGTPILGGGGLRFPRLLPPFWGEFGRLVPPFWGYQNILPILYEFVPARITSSQGRAFHPSEKPFLL